jgi:hypothetical protein
VHYGIAANDAAIAPAIRRPSRITIVATRAATYALACCRACAIERIPAATGLAAGTERMATMTTPPMVAPRRVTTPPRGVATTTVPPRRVTTPPVGLRSVTERGRFPTPSNGVPVATQRIPTERPRLPTQEPPQPDLAKLSEARAAASRGQIALDAKEYDVAIAELTTAIELDPDRVTYRAMLAWAEFCAAPDKEAIAEATRRALATTVPTSEDPVMPVYSRASPRRSVAIAKLRLYQRVVHSRPSTRRRVRKCGLSSTAAESVACSIDSVADRSRYDGMRDMEPMTLAEIETAPFRVNKTARFEASLTRCSRRWSIEELARLVSDDVSGSVDHAEDERRRRRA